MRRWVASNVLPGRPVNSPSDSKCGNLTLDDTGTKGLSGTYSGTVADCWR